MNVPPLFIFNLRIWKIHFQIERFWKIEPLFKWYDFWIGLFVDVDKRIYYIFPLPTIGIKITGFWICWNSTYKFRDYPFIWLFQFGNRYREYKRNQ